MIDWKLYIDSPLQKSLIECGRGSLNEGNGCGSSCGFSPNGWGDGYGWGAPATGGAPDCCSDIYGGGWGCGSRAGYGNLHGSNLWYDNEYSDNVTDGDGGSETEW